ncbi:hypothetical protein LTR78_001270 [Recurvomyces mirabilis]|uniref:Heterokaryon incompatibility domain-containing protein n=1 Tax=Recurvomyces mirabilis TaxID=574656 RepID=A0AAE0WV38_9PEZI|nr:hypothetical protein LTR78_001270 [Recurvomyces mirabilis]KAK5161246.1 hypothetical protein LTS14_001042 [Recurvomyces mirabilis]
MSGTGPGQLPGIQPNPIECEGLLYLALDAKKQEIRLLDLEPCTPDANLAGLVCDMRIVSLVDILSPRYEAISYAWGDNEAKAEIRVNGIPINVPINTAAALLRVRDVDKVRTLWIDAVCINQQDIEERNSQVALMAAIYKSSWRVIVWLGNPGFSEREGHQAISTIDTAVDAIIAWAMSELHIGTYETLIAQLATYKSIDGLMRRFPHQLLAQVAQVYAVCHQFWFGRRWVVQEVALAQQTICYWGRITMSLERALVAAVIMARGSPSIDQWRTIHNLSGYGSTHSASIDELYKAARMWQVLRMPSARSAGALLSANLEQLQDSLGSEPRDLVYSILGLWQRSSGIHELPSLLQPDYGKPVGRVFADAQRYIMRSEKSVNMLQDTRTAEVWPTSDQGSSWVKRWSVWHQNAPSLLPTCHSACGKRPYEADLREPDRELWLRGIEIGTVTDCVTAVSPEALSTTAGQRAFMDSLITSLSIEVLAYQPLARTLVAGVTWQGRVLTNVRLITDAETEMAVAVISSSPETHENVVPDRAMLESNLSAAARYSYGLKRACQHRAIFRTENGRCGLGPSKTMAGDVVAVVDGCDFPLLLRPLKHGYELVGVCYVDGFMQGEAVDSYKTAELGYKMFVLL